MQNVFMKITAVVGVAGILCLIVLQLQRGVNEPSGENTAEVQPAEAAEANDNSQPAAPPNQPGDIQQSEPQVVQNVPTGQSEPNPFLNEAPGRADLNPEPSPEPPQADRSTDTGRGLDFRDRGPRLLPARQAMPEEDAPDPNPFAGSAGDGEQDSAKRETAGRDDGESTRELFELLSRENAGQDSAAPKTARAEHIEPVPEEPEPAVPDAAEKAEDASQPVEPKVLAVDESAIPIAESSRPKAGTFIKSPRRLPLFRGDPSAPSQAAPENNDPFDNSETTAASDAGFAKAGPPDSPEDSSLPEEQTEPTGGENEMQAEQPDPAETALDETTGEGIEVNGEMQPLSFPSDKRAAERAAAEQRPVQLVQSEEAPQPLQPALGAAPITPSSAAGVQGEATADPSVPQGQQRPELTIEKTAPRNAVLGQPMIYHILVKNVGNSAASDVVVDDLIPRGTKLTGTIPRAELSGTRLMWRLGELKPGEEKKIAIRVIPTSEGVVGSVANVRFAAAVASQTVVSSPKLELAVKAPEKAKVGEPVVLEFKLTNNSPADATGVTIRDVIPAALKHERGNDLEYEIGTVPAGKSRELKLVLTAAEVGEIVNRAIVTADGGVSAEAKTPLAIVGTRLKIERIGPAKHYLGRPATFENRVTNSSPRPVVGASVVETIPAGLEFVEASTGGQYDPRRRSIVWALGKLDPNQTKVLKAKFIPKALGEQRSVVNAIEPNGATSQTVGETSILGFTTLTMDVQSAGVGPTTAGEQTKYRIAVANRGSAPATNVRLSVNVPPETELVQFPNMLKPVAGGDVHQFPPVGSLKPGQQIVVEISLKALKPGDARLGISVQSDQMQSPLSRQEAILILPAAP